MPGVTRCYLKRALSNKVLHRVRVDGVVAGNKRMPVNAALSTCCLDLARSLCDISTLPSGSFCCPERAHWSLLCRPLVGKSVKVDDKGIRLLRYRSASSQHIVMRGHSASAPAPGCPYRGSWRWPRREGRRALAPADFGGLDGGGRAISTS